MASRPYLSPHYWITVLLVIFWMISLSPSNKRPAIAVNQEARPGYAEKERDGRFEPNEQFFYDRNYPDSNFHYDAFRRRLEASMAYDESTPRSRRGLEFPWTIQGPGNIGARVNTIAVNPVDAQVMLIGFSQGGIYRTEDGGQTWDPVFDEQGSLSISDIQFDPVDANHVWATTGDVNISGYYFIGAGVYESKNSGRTWKYRGLKDAGILSKIAIDNNPNYLYVGSMGFPAQKGNERGFYRSTNGGQTWEKTLTIDDSTGIIDIVADRTKSGRVFASASMRLRSNTISKTLIPGTSVYKSDDYGATWINLTNGLPQELHSRTSIEITDAGIIFVSYSGKKSAHDSCGEYTEELKNIYRSDDSGSTWVTIPTQELYKISCTPLGKTGWYYDAIRVNPNDPEDIFVLGVDLYRTRDGGNTWKRGAPPYEGSNVHEDKHALVFAHGQLFLGTDGGAYKTGINDTPIWIDMENIVSTQYYRTTWNPNAPDQFYGGAQDNGTTGGKAAGINEWSRYYNLDGFQPLFVSSEPTWMFALRQWGDMGFSEDGGKTFNWISNGFTGDPYWDMPFVASPFDPKVLYRASDRVFKLNMNDSDRIWKSISPDLTKQIPLAGGRYPAVTAIAQSPVDELRMYAGTQDGLIWTTADGGQNWTNITDGTPGAFVTSIACSIVDLQSVYVTYSGFRDNDHEAYIYHSDDAGLHWESIGANIPMMGVNNIFIMPGSGDRVLLVGTDGGVYVSFDSGEQWDRVGDNMPYFPVYDIDFNPITNLIIAATFARGIMTFPLEQLELETGVTNPAGTELSGISIYPTITSNFVNIKIGDKEILKKKILISLVDVNGRKQDETYLSSVANQKFTFRDGLPGGVYYIVIQSEEFCSARTILIQ